MKLNRFTSLADMAAGSLGDRSRMGQVFFNAGENAITRDQSAEAQSAGLPVPAASANHEGRKMISEKKRILVVDDEPSITRLLKLNLEQTGDYEVATENIAKAALAAAEEFQPDLLLLDVVMPGLDGGSLASQFQTSPKLEGTPIVFLTAAVTREEVRARHGLVGGQPFLAKPVSLQEVLACLERHLRPSREPAATASFG